MPILNVEDEVEIELTHDCNWDCRYCPIRTRSLSRISESDALKKVKKAVTHKSVTFSGGEPGMLPRWTLEAALDIVEHAGSAVYLNTNGLFLRRYPDLSTKFRQIIYHCSRDLDDRLTRYNGLGDIRYMLVIDDINYPKLKSYLEAHDGVKFDIAPASYEPGDSRRPLSVCNRMRIAEDFRDRITDESLRRLFVDKDFDKIKYL